MLLNTPKIILELKRLGKNKAWLAKQAGASPQQVNYWFRTRTIRPAARIARVFLIDPRDLIVSTQEEDHYENLSDQEVHN
jgi:hypothetical protein